MAAPLFSEESPVLSSRVEGRTPEVETFEGDAGVLKVNGMGQVSAGEFGFPVEEQIVIPGDDELMTKGQGTEPGIEVVQLFYPGTMDHEVARWKSQLAMEAVSIPDADEAERIGARDCRCHDPHSCSVSLSGFFTISVRP